MTQNEIISMAREAGFDEHHAKFDTRLESFAKLVAEKEREACAKLGEDEISRIKPIYSVTGENIVKAIRARGEQ